MKKRIYLVSLAFILAISAVGCGKKKDIQRTEENTVASGTDAAGFPAEATDTRSDLLIFVNKSLVGIEDKRQKALDIYNSYFEAGDADIDEYAKKLKKEALPAMKEYLEELKAIELKTEEVSALREELYECVSKQYKAMKYVYSAINELNHDNIVKADKQIKKSDEIYKQYQTDLSELAKSCNIEVSGK